ncbi:MAG: class II aldolase/adducin family protein [Actinobacteria bacterium]|nr:class II aldolase/adducin family protein [Actinomycetota bacterium]
MPQELRDAIVAAGQSMLAEGLVIGSAGNISARGPVPGTMCITPSRMSYKAMTPAHVVTVTFEGDPVEGASLPSSESLLHGAIYRARPEVRAVLHAHPIFASVLAVRHERIPPIADEQVVYLGGAVEVSAYAPPGSDGLARNAVQALGPRAAVLLANHGTVAVGGSPEHALEITRLVERLARIWYFAAARPGAQMLPDDLVAAETELYAMLHRSEVPDAPEGS